MIKTNCMAHIDGKWRRARMEVIQMKKLKRLNVGDRVYFNPFMEGCEGFATIEEVVSGERGTYKIVPDNWNQMGGVTPYEGNNFLFAYNDDYSTQLTLVVPVEEVKAPVHMNKFNAGDRVLFTLIRQSSLDTWKEVDVRIYGTVTECFNEHKGYYRIKPDNHCDLDLVRGKRGISPCNDTLSCYETELTKENDVNTELCDKRYAEYLKYEADKTEKEGTIMDPKLMAATTLDTTKNDKRIKASARYSRATFWGAVILTSGAGQYVWSKAPVALHAFGEFLVNLSGK